MSVPFTPEVEFNEWALRLNKEVTTLQRQLAECRADLERKHEAYCIAHDQATQNGAATVRAEKERDEALQLVPAWAAKTAAAQVNELTAKLERAEKERDRLREALQGADSSLAQALGLIVEFGDLNGFRNMSDEELGGAVMGVAEQCARSREAIRAALQSDKET